MKVRCINPYFQLEENKIYEVVDENKEFYYISDELGYIGGFFKERFEIIEEKPMRLDLKEFNNIPRLKQELKDCHIYVAAENKTGEKSLIFSGPREGFRISNNSIGVTDIDYYKKYYTIIADVTDRVKILL